MNLRGSREWLFVPAVCTVNICLFSLLPFNQPHWQRVWKSCPTPNWCLFYMFSRTLLIVFGYRWADHHFLTHVCLQDSRISACLSSISVFLTLLRTWEGGVHFHFLILMNNEPWAPQTHWAPKVVCDSTSKWLKGVGRCLRMSAAH